MFVFAGLAATAGVFEFTKPKEGKMNTSREFLRFRTNYIVVYSFMMGAGPPSRSLPTLVCPDHTAYALRTALCKPRTCRSLVC